MKNLTISQIQNIVCDYYRIPVDAIQTKGRKRELVQARQVSMYFARIKKCGSLREIGLEIAGRDHATVLHACKTVNNLIDTDKDLKYDIYRIERELLNLEKRIFDEPVARDIEIADLHDYFPHPGSYPEVTVIKFFKPKLLTLKFSRLHAELDKIICKPFVSPFAGMPSRNDREYSGYREHSL